LGISGQSVTAALAQQLELSINTGVYVVSVSAGSPADKAGLKGGNFDSRGQVLAGGDVITAVDGDTINTIQELQSYIKAQKAGDTVTLSILRSGAAISIQATLAERPETISSSGTPDEIPQTPNFQPRMSPIPGFPGGQGWYYRGVPQN
jgi:S1-C subfamily serine protease